MANDHVREELVQYAGRVRSYVTRFASKKYAVEDLVQDTFVQAFQAVRRHGPPREPLPWLLTIAHRTGIAGLKYALKHRHDTLYGEPVDHNPGPIERAEQREDLNRMHDGMAQLLEPDRLLLQARYLDQRTLRELSQRQGITYENTKVRLYRTRRRLRRILNIKKGGEHE